MKTILFEQGAMGNRKTLQGAAEFFCKIWTRAVDHRRAQRGGMLMTWGHGSHEEKVFVPSLMKLPYILLYLKKGLKSWQSQAEYC